MMPDLAPGAYRNAAWSGGDLQAATEHAERRHGSLDGGALTNWLTAEIVDCSRYAATTVAPFFLRRAPAGLTKPAAVAVFGLRGSAALWLFGSRRKAHFLQEHHLAPVVLPNV